MSAKDLILLCCLWAAPVALAEELPACANTFESDLGDAAVPVTEGNPETFHLEAGRFEAGLKEPRFAELGGGVAVRRGDRLAGAEEATLDPDRRALYLAGDVRYEDPETRIVGDRAEFAYDSGLIRFSGAEFILGQNNSRGAAEELLITEAGRLELDGVSYTTCPPGSEDWLLLARDIDLDTRSGVGTARGIKLRFQGVPILYAPYLSFPIGDARKSGLLTPEIGSAGRSGNEVRVPWYWNIAPNYDATLAPRLLTDRGLQFQGQFRYLTRVHGGSIDGEYLADDSLTDETRSLIDVNHRSLFENGWRARLDFSEVSDSQYFEDLGGSLSASSITHLNRSLIVDYFSDGLWLSALVQDYQTLDDAIVPADEPYRRVPQFEVNGFWPDRIAGIDFDVRGELVNFDRDVGVTGWRFNVRPNAEAPIGQPGWFITPAVALDYTRYELEDTAPGIAASPSRTLPIGSVDTGLVLERMINGSGRQRLQTLEPRLLYVHIPFREQSDLPVFDTIQPDLNLVQLFRKNRFLGVDRIADTDQLSVGLTSRILNVSTGRELLAATIGQTRFLSASGVELPGTPLTTSESTDYIAEVRFLLYESLNFDLGHQWGTDGSGTTQSEARLQYRPAGDKVLNLAYRFRRDSLEQGDISFAWPVTDRWNIVGRYNYSFRDSEPLEQFFGVEYESCCWGFRLVSRRFISTRDGTRDSSVSLQLVLKGMSSLGSPTDKLLERGILGYSSDTR